MLINNFFNYILFKYKDFIEVYKSKLGYSKNLDLIRKAEARGGVFISLRRKLVDKIRA